jgi:hypothetical protein
VPLENLEMSERKGIISPMQFMGNVIPPTPGPRGSNSWQPWLMLVNTMRMMQACQRSRSDANCKGPKVVRNVVDSDSFMQPVVRSGGAVRRPAAPARRTPFPEVESLEALTANGSNHQFDIGSLPR